jgi:hypothetical protein
VHFQNDKIGILAKQKFLLLTEVHSNVIINFVRLPEINKPIPDRT